MTTTDLMTAAPSLARAEILARPVGPWPRHCAGYPLDPVSGGSVPVWHLDPVTDAGTALLTAFPSFPGAHCSLRHPASRSGRRRPSRCGRCPGDRDPRGTPRSRRPPDAALFMKGLITRRLASARQTCRLARWCATGSADGRMRTRASRRGESGLRHGRSGLRWPSLIARVPRMQWRDARAMGPLPRHQAGYNLSSG